MVNFNEEDKSPVNSINDNSTIVLINEMSNLLQVDLDLELMTICQRMVERGINPKLLAQSIKEIKKQS